MFNSWSFSRNSAGQKGIAKHIQSTEREKSTSKISLPSKDLTQNWWRNQKLFRQAKVKRIQYHQTSFTTNVKGTYIVKKYKRRKIYKINPKQLRNVKRNIYKNNYFKCKWIKCSKQKRLAEWIQKEDPFICCLQETHFRPQDTYRLKVRGWKNIFHAMGSERKLE